MSASRIAPGALVLYKGRPARVQSVGRKLAIVTEDGDTISVRHKDVTLLHPGPFDSFAALVKPTGEVRVAWELLAGTTTTLRELAELAFGAYEPATAWASWELVTDGLYFSGVPDAILVHQQADVEETIAAREAKAAEKAAWDAFVARLETGKAAPEDERYLDDVVALALEKRDQSRVLRDLGRAETRENAHALLLEVGYWDETVNPYPRRFEVALDQPVAKLPPVPAETRVDLTHLTALAIDDEGSADPDDAISLDGDTLWVHVADAAALVLPGSGADREALARGANLYLPEGTVYMLPAAATDQLALGLQPVSPALTFEMRLNQRDEVESLQLYPSAVRVTRMTYEEAENQLPAEPLASLAALATRRKQKRLARGAIDLALPEVKVRVEGGTIEITPLPDLASRSIVLEAMLLVGEAVAQYAIANSIPIPFSTQDAPPEATLPEGLAGEYAQVRLLRRSQRSSQPGPHAGLGLNAYVQATSPLRRYLDLVTHQQLRAHLRGETLLDQMQVQERIGAADAAYGIVRTVERLSVGHWTHAYLQRQPDWEGAGVIVDLNGSRSTVLVPALALEFQAYLRSPAPLNAQVLCRLHSVNLPTLEAHFQVRSV